MDIANRVRASPRAGDGREADESWRLLPLCAQEGGGREIAEVVVAGKGAIRTGSAGVDSSLGHLGRGAGSEERGREPRGAWGDEGKPYTLVIEASDLLAEDKVLEERGAALAGFETPLVLYGAADVAAEVALAIVDIELGHVLAGAARIGPAGKILGLRIAKRTRAMGEGREAQRGGGEDGANHGGGVTRR